MVSRLLPHLNVLLFCCILFGQLSCTQMVVSVMQPMMRNIQQQTNIELVCEGSPAYLLMLDSMLVSRPDDRTLLLSAVQSYSGYAAALEECEGNGSRKILPVVDKARLYGLRLLRQHLPLGAGAGPEAAGLLSQLRRLQTRDVPELFWGCYGWLAWVKEQRGSPEAIADLVEIEKIMARLLQLDETYQGGAVHLFFGTYYASKPAMFGGRPDLSKIHFEKALQVSGRRFLLTQTTYAETLARATFDRELHDQLLKEVLAFPLDSAPEFALSNHIAVNRAKRLLQENYFAD